MSPARRRSSGEGSVYRRADGKWAGSLDLGWHDGRRRRKYVYADTEREVLAKLRTARRAAEAGQDLTKQSPALAVWLAEWLTMKEAQGTRFTTMQSYRILVTRHIVPTLGRTRLDALTPTAVRRLVEAKTTEGLSAASVRQVHGLLRNALGDAERHELVSRNVAKVVRPPGLVRPERRSLGVADARRLLDTVRGDRLEALWVAALTLGLRRGELLGLTWADVDIEGRHVRVRQTLQRVDGRLQLVAPKTDRSRRTIPVPALTLAALIAHRERQGAEAAALGECWTETGLVFVSQIGTALEPSNIDRRWYAVRDRAGLPWVRLHDLRHACATLLLATGASPRVVMQTLGHSQIGLTMNTYAHVLPEVERAAVDAMAELLEDATP